MRLRAALPTMLVLLAIGAPAARAAVDVTTDADVSAVDGQCSLREALAAAVAHDPAAPDCAGATATGTVTVDLPAGDYVLAQGQLEVLDPTADVALTGAGARATTIHSDPGDRLLDVAAGAKASVEAVTLTGGRAPAGEDGGAVRNAGTLTLTSTSIADSRAGAGTDGLAAGSPGSKGGDGGGIASTGTLTLDGVSLSDVHAGDGGNGAAGAAGVGTTPGGVGGVGGSGGQGGGLALGASGAHTLADVRITRGSGGDGGAGGVGGAADSGAGGVGGAGGQSGAAGALAITGASVADLEATDNDSGAGGVGGAGGSSASGTGGLGGAGGAAVGGGAILTSGTVSITRATITGNDVGPAGRGGAAGVGQDPGHGGAGGNVIGGGGLFHPQGALTLGDVLLADNDAGVGGAGGTPDGTAGVAGRGGGLVAFDGSVVATNATITGNHVAAGGRGGGVALAGGGSGTVALHHVTVAGNTAVGSAVGGTSGVADLRGSIVAGNAGGAQCSGANGATRAAIADTTTCGVVAADPKLGALGDHGGPTETLLPAAGSPAIDAADSGVCPATDQRGAKRPAGARCDAGAVEVVPPPSCAPVSVFALTGNAARLTLTCTEAVGDPMSYEIVDAPVHGTVHVSSDGIATYTPAAGFMGTDTFTYRASSPFGGTGAAATATVSIGDVVCSDCGGWGPLPPPGPPAPPSPPSPPTLPKPPVAGPTRQAFRGLSIKAKQKGTAVKGSLKIAYANSKLTVTLTIPGKTKKSEPITIGTAAVKKVKAGKRSFTIKLDKKHGRTAQKRHKSLKVTVRVKVTPPTGTARTQTKTITLTR